MLGALISKSNKHLTPSQKVYSQKEGNTYKVQTIENNAIFEGFNKNDTTLLMQGFLEALKIIKPIKKK